MTSEQAFIVVFRLVHIITGVIWAGGVWVVAYFILPAARETPEAGGFMRALMVGRRLPDALLTAAGITILSGLALYERASGGFNGAWIMSGTGLGYTVGGLSAIGAALLGARVNRPTALRIGALGQTIQASGGPPSPEQAAEMAALQDRLGRATRATAWMLLVAVAAMAVARYL